MSHPDATDLALLAGGDLPLVRRLRIALHVRLCSRCQEEVDLYRAAAARLHESSEALPAGLAWDRLADEMTANIRLGIEAGECVAVRPASASLSWRSATVMAAMSLVLIVAWWLNPPARRLEPTMRARQIEIRNTATGLELNEGGNALVLLHGRSSSQTRPIIVSTPGNLRARVVDAETGQMTINNVYAE